MRIELSFLHLYNNHCAPNHFPVLKLLFAELENSLVKAESLDYYSLESTSRPISNLAEAGRAELDFRRNRKTFFHYRNVMTYDIVP